MSLSLGEYAAICRHWAKAHEGKDSVTAPSEDEFEHAVMAARGVT